MPKSALPTPTQDMFIHNNPYGYKIAIRHPIIQPLFQRYKKSKGLSMIHPVSDQERIEFENILFEYWQKKQAKSLFTGIERRTEKST